MLYNISKLHVLLLKPSEWLQLFTNSAFWANLPTSMWPAQAETMISEKGGWWELTLWLYMKVERTWCSSERLLQVLIGIFSISAKHPWGNTASWLRGAQEGPAMSGISLCSFFGQRVWESRRHNCLKPVLLPRSVSDPPGTTWTVCALPLSSSSSQHGQVSSSHRIQEGPSTKCSPVGPHWFSPLRCVLRIVPPALHSFTADYPKNVTYIRKCLNKATASEIPWLLCSHQWFLHTVIMVLKDNKSLSFSKGNYFVNEEGSFAKVQSSHRKLLTAHVT